MKHGVNSADLAKVIYATVMNSGGGFQPEVIAAHPLENAHILVATISPNDALDTQDIASEYCKTDIGNFSKDWITQHFRRRYGHRQWIHMIGNPWLLLFPKVPKRHEKHKGDQIRMFFSSHAQEQICLSSLWRNLLEILQVCLSIPIIIFHDEDI